MLVLDTALPEPRRTLRAGAMALRAWTRRQVLAAAGFTVAFALLLGIPTVLIPNPVFGREVPVTGWSYPVWILSSLLAGMLAATYVRPGAGLDVPARRPEPVPEPPDGSVGPGPQDSDAAMGSERAASVLDLRTGREATAAVPRSGREATAVVPRSGREATAVVPGAGRQTGAAVIAAGREGPDVIPASGDAPARFGMAGTVLAWFAVGCPVCNKLALLALGYAGALRWFAPAQPYLAGLALVTTAGALLVRLRGQVLCPARPHERSHP